MDGESSTVHLDVFVQQKIAEIEAEVYRRLFSVFEGLEGQKTTKGHDVTGYLKTLFECRDIHTGWMKETLASSKPQTMKFLLIKAQLLAYQKALNSRADGFIRFVPYTVREQPGADILSSICSVVASVITLVKTILNN